MRKQLLNALLLVLGLVFFAGTKAQIPSLESKPGSNYVLYLDFDGAIVTGTFWNSIYNYSNPIFAPASGQNNTGITNTWKQVSEDFRPFDINVTTDSTVYNSATAGQRMWVIITPSDTWFGAGLAGGVAFLGSFTWTSKTPCWCFENNLGYTAEYIAECASHEGGHTFNLVHQSSYTTSCVKTEYNPGAGTGQISWAPIMGVGYYNNVTTFYNGFSTSGCSTRQNDWSVLLSSNGFGLRADEYGNSRSTATVIPMTSTAYDTSGIIIDSNDVDYLKLSVPSAATISITAKPFSLNTSNKKANLDIRLELQDSAGNVLYASDSATILNAFLNNMSLAAGNYYIVIDGVGSANYTDYGSVGLYKLSITSSIPLSKNEITITKNKLNDDMLLLDWTYPAPETIKNSWWVITDAKGSYTQKQEIRPFEQIKINRQWASNAQYLKIGLETYTGSTLYSEWVPLTENTGVKVSWEQSTGSVKLSGNNLRKTEFAMYSLNGKLVYKGYGNEHKPQIANSGIYVYKISGSNTGQGKILCN